jgi:hypothetical protein
MEKLEDGTVKRVNRYAERRGMTDSEIEYMNQCLEDLKYQDYHGIGVWIDRTFVARNETFSNLQTLIGEIYKPKEVIRICKESNPDMNIEVRVGSLGFGVYGVNIESQYSGVAYVIEHNGGFIFNITK